MSIFGSLVGNEQNELEEEHNSNYTEKVDNQEAKIKKKCGLSCIIEHIHLNKVYMLSTLYVKILYTKNNFMEKKDCV